MSYGQGAIDELYGEEGFTYGFEFELPDACFTSAEDGEKDIWV